MLGIRDAIRKTVGAAVKAVSPQAAAKAAQQRVRKESGRVSKEAAVTTRPKINTANKLRY